jgi:predicted O-methyltransferase YrrM
MKLKVDFNRDPGEGQMKFSERQAMYDQIITHKPMRMLEIGTWKGGGSTYILSCAAYEYGGKLDTIEANKEFYDHAVNLYATRMNILLPHVTFIFGHSHDVLPELLTSRGGYDFVFFDGAEDPDQTVKEYNIVNEHLALGSLIACHDWKTSKMDKLKSIIANDNTWQNIVSIDNTETGFQMFKRSL